MDRYPVDGSADDKVYQITITFRNRESLSAKAMGESAEYRALVSKQMDEQMQLMAWHAQERVSFLLK